MAKQTFNVGGTQVRAEDQIQANALANEINPTGSITTSALAPQKQISIPAPTPATESTNFNTYLEKTAQNQNDAFTQEQENNLKRSSAGYRSSLSDYITASLGSVGTEGATQEAFKQYGVDEKAKAVKDINQQILADTEAERVQIEELKKNAQGFVGTGLSDKIAEIQDRGIQRRAALNITKLAALGEYDSARETADRAVSAILERQKIKNDTLRFAYEENKDLFTRDEQRLFETRQKYRERELNMKEFEIKARFEQSIKQSDPLYKAQLAKAQAEAALPGGVAGNTLTTQAGYAKLTPKQKSQADSLNNLVNYLNEYKTLYSTSTSIAGSKLTGANAALLEAKLNSLLFAAAQAEGTGALQQADREVLEKVLPNPTTFAGSLGALYKGGQQGGISKIEDQIAKYTNNLATLGLSPVTGNTEDPLGLGISSAGTGDNPLGI